MLKEFETADEVFNRKYEERGWNQETENSTKESIEKIASLPLSEEEYRNFSWLLAKLALLDKNVALCDIYFELQRRANYGNRYAMNEDMATIEEQLWNIGTREVVNQEESSHKNR